MSTPETDTPTASPSEGRTRHSPRNVLLAAAGLALFLGPTLVSCSNNDKDTVVPAPSASTSASAVPPSQHATEAADRDRYSLLTDDERAYLDAIDGAAERADLPLMGARQFEHSTPENVKSYVEQERRDSACVKPRGLLQDASNSLAKYMWEVKDAKNRYLCDGPLVPSSP